MLAPPRSPKRHAPPPSPSRSLMGMEKVVPPRTRSSSRSPFSSAADVNKPLPPRTRSSSRSPFSSAADTDKPLPERPRSSSSVYTGDSGYTRIVDTNSNHSRRDGPPVPLLIQPVAYQETISALLRRRLEDPPSPKSVPSGISIATQDSQTPSHSYQVSLGSLTVSATSALSAVDSRKAPSFKEFSNNLQNKRLHAVGAVSPPSPSPQTSPQLSPEFWAVSYESTRRAPSISPRTLDMVDRTLVPPPLSVNKNKSSFSEGQPSPNHTQPEIIEERSESRFSSSDDSYVIYTGIRDSVRAYVRHKMQKKRDSGKKERKMVMLAASAKYPGMLTAKEHDRKFSSGSRKDSIQQGISAVYDKISKLSVSGPSGQTKDENTQPRGRQKQLAIPTSPYQKYGAAVWEAPKRQKRVKRASDPPKSKSTKKNSDEGQIQRPSTSAHPGDVVGAFKNGRSQIIHALDDTKHKLTRSNSERRREALKQSIRFVGRTDQVSDGTMSYHI